MASKLILVCSYKVDRTKQNEKKKKKDKGKERKVRLHEEPPARDLPNKKNAKLYVRLLCTAMLRSESKNTGCSFDQFSNLLFKRIYQFHWVRFFFEIKACTAKNFSHTRTMCEGDNKRLYAMKPRL